MSDIHANKNKFYKALDAVRFNKAQDKIFVIGDIIDRGSGSSLELLKFCRDNTEITLILGNHEYFLRMYLEGQLSRQKWCAMGGENTLKELESLTELQKQEILEYIKSLPLYVVLSTSGGEKILLTHAGLDADIICYSDDGIVSVVDSIERAFKENPFKYIVSNDIHFMAARVLNNLDYDKIIVGHYPCQNLNEDGGFHIFNGLNYIDIDSGCGYAGGKLAVYCLESGEVIYV